MLGTLRRSLRLGASNRQHPINAPSEARHPGVPAPTTPRGNDLNEGLKVLETVMEICDVVDEVAAKHKLSKAPLLKFHSDNIRDVVDDWEASDFAFLEGPQLTGMMAALYNLHQALKMPRDKALRKQGKRVIIRKKKLAASLMKCLQQVEANYQEFQREVESLVRQSRNDSPLDHSVTPSDAAALSPAPSSGSFADRQDDRSLPSPIKPNEATGQSFRSLKDQRWSSSDEDDDDLDTPRPLLPPSDGGEPLGDAELHEHDHNLDSARTGAPSSGSLVSGEVSVSDMPLADPHDSRIRAEKAPALPTKFRLDLHGSDSQHRVPNRNRKEKGGQDQHGPPFVGFRDGGNSATVHVAPVQAKATDLGNVAGPAELKQSHASAWDERVPPEIMQLRELVAAADGGDPAAAMELGILLREGKVVERNLVEALEYLRVAAEAGNPEACYMVGCMASSGEGLAAPDLQEAAAWYRRAACQGHPEACAAFGQALEHGVATNQNLRAAAAWYRKAAHGGSARGANNLGKLFFDGRGVTQDVAKAAAWFKYAAKCKGERCAAALNNLGICYEDGLGLARDLDAAAQCYQRAADEGHLGALLNLAYLQFDRGNLPAARMSFELAAARGNADALYSLACIVERQATISESAVHSTMEEERDVLGEGGHHVNDDASKAYSATLAGHANAGKLYQRAAEAGDPRAQHKLGAWYWDQGWVDDALVMFHMAAAQQHAPSLNALGIIAEEGQMGFEKDVQAAWECYRLAALYGSAQAEANLRSLEEIMQASELEKALRGSGFQAGLSSSKTSEGKVVLPQQREPLLENVPIHHNDQQRWRHHK